MDQSSYVTGFEGLSVASSLHFVCLKIVVWQLASVPQLNTSPKEEEKVLMKQHGRTILLDDMMNTGDFMLMDTHLMIGSLSFIVFVGFILFDSLPSNVTRISRRFLLKTWRLRCSHFVCK